MQFEHKISQKINHSVCFAECRVIYHFEVLNLYLLDGSYTLPILHSRLGVNPHYPSCRHFYPIWRQLESGASLAGSSKANTEYLQKVWSFNCLGLERSHHMQTCNYHIIAIRKQSATPDNIVLFIRVHRLKSFTLQDCMATGR